MSDSADEDLRDVFKLLYDTEEWAMDDDEDTAEPEAEKSIGELEVEQVEADLEDPTERLLERYSRKRFMDDLDSLMEPNTKRPRIYSQTSASTSNASIPCTSPFPSLPSPSTYAPFSPLPLLARLRTFEPSSYSPHMPSPLAAGQAALYGWTNDGRDSLWCGVCQARWDLRGVTEIREEKVRMEVARRLGPGLENKHRKGCSWRVRRSPETLNGQLLRLLHPPITSNLSVLAFALEVECIARAKSEFRWISPLTSPQLENLLSRLRNTKTHDPSSESDPTNRPPSLPISSFAAALALFCWYPFHLNGPTQTISSSSSKRTDIVQCRLCERRVGLWAFRSDKDKAGDERTFDLVGEHLGWCPVRDDMRDGKWWEDLPLSKSREKVEVGPSKGWISVSGKLEVRPWRRVRGGDTAAT